MTTLTVTTRGQVTFRKEVLKHLGIQPGGKIRLDLLPDGRAQLKADQPKGSWQEVRGMLKGKTNGARLSIEEISDAIADAGAAAGMLLLQTLGLGNYNVFGSVVTTCSIAPAWMTGPSGEMVHDVKARCSSLTFFINRRPGKISRCICLQWWYCIPGGCSHVQSAA